MIRNNLLLLLLFLLLLDLSSLVSAAQSTTFSYIGAAQTYTVPSGVSFLLVKLWGAGGGGGSSNTSAVANQFYGAAGGTGGYSTCYIAVDSGQELSIIVGGGGETNTFGVSASGGFGGGGDSILDSYKWSAAGGGGGRSAIRSSKTSAVDLITAGGGGGGGAGGGYAGPGGGLTGGSSTYTGGGTQTSSDGGCGTCAQYKGGNGRGYAAGGGSGWWGGSGGVPLGYGPGVIYPGGGGGGSGYLGGCTLSSGSASYTETGLSSTPFNTVDAAYVSGVGIAGLASTSNDTYYTSLGYGGNGLVVITPVASSSSDIVFMYSGKNVGFQVPPGVSYLHVKMWGAGGGGGTKGPSAQFASYNSYGGGAGGYAQCYLSVTSYQLLTIIVGGGGAASDFGTLAAGGFGGGGDGGGSFYNAGGGGGRTAIRDASDSELMTAGGGGGGGINTEADGGAGGGAGGGLAGLDAFAAMGGSQYFDGNSGSGGESGSQYQGGTTTNFNIKGGGGGGGVWGGASGGYTGKFVGGGAGGSAYVSGCLSTATFFTGAGSSGTKISSQSSTINMNDDSSYIQGVGLGGLSGESNSSYLNGYGGDGLVVISFLYSAPPSGYTFPYVGGAVDFVVPAAPLGSTTFLLVKVWGGGGGGGTYQGSGAMSFGGGAGGFSTCFLSFVAGVWLDIIVGQGGASSKLGTNAAGGFGGGGEGMALGGLYFSVGGGGGRSAIRSPGGQRELVTAGGGGGGGATFDFFKGEMIGGGGGGLNGLSSGTCAIGYVCVSGGNGTSGGRSIHGLNGNGGAGSQYKGGTTTVGSNGNAYGAGGGGGYFGGGSGPSWTLSNTDGDIGGGGGGSGYIGGCLDTSVRYMYSGASGNSSGQASTVMMNDTSYITGIGLGGQPSTSNSTTSSGNGGDGLVVITVVTSMMPSSSPTGLPTFTPTSSRPTGQPSNQPSRQPSHQPSNQPTSQPNSWPTSSPSLNCLPGKYVTGNKCSPCEAGKYSATTGQLACDDCAAGKFNALTSQTVCTACAIGKFSSIGGSLECSACSVGKIQAATGGKSCVTCAAGTWATGTALGICTPCATGYYNPGGNSSTGCLVCAGGRITPGTGTINAGDCLLPATNFAMGVIALVLCLFIAIEYVLFGRFHRVAFIRKERVIKPFVEMCITVQKKIKEFNDQLDLANLFISESIKSGRSEAKKPSAYKGALFLFLSLIIFIFSSIVTYMVMLLSVFFKSLILWRGYNFDLNITFIAQVEQAIDKLGIIVQLPGIPKLLFFPFVELFRLLANFKLDFSSVNVTCQGSSAPIELFLNMLVLGSVILVIEGGYQFFQNVTFNVLNDTFLKTLVKKEYRKNTLGIEDTSFWIVSEDDAYDNDDEDMEEDVKAKDDLARVTVHTTVTGGSFRRGFSKKASLQASQRGSGKEATKIEGRWSLSKYLRYLLYTASIGGISKMDFFQSILQYLMALVKISPFTQDAGTHPITNACDQIASLSFIDSVLGKGATIIAYLLLFPIIYEVASVLVPGIPDLFRDEHTSEQNLFSPLQSSTHEPRSHLVMRYLLKGNAFLAFDLVLAKLASLWLVNMSRALDVAKGKNDKKVGESAHEEEQGQQASKDSSFNAKNKSIYDFNFSFYHKSEETHELDSNTKILFSSFSQRTEEELASWREKCSNSFPSYWDLCEIEYEELFVLVDRTCSYLHQHIKESCCGEDGFFTRLLGRDMTKTAANLDTIRVEVREGTYTDEDEGRGGWGSLSLKSDKFNFDWTPKSRKSAKEVEIPSSIIMASSSSSSSTSLSELQGVSSSSSLPTSQMSVSEYLGHLSKQALSALLVFCCIGHLLTPSGSKVWVCVFYKYYCFLLVTCGYWTTDLCNVFDLMPLLKKLSISQLDTKNNAALQTDFSNGMAALINARAILYQVFPQLTIITIFVCNMSATPLFVRNTVIAKHLPDLIAWTSCQDCKEEQTEAWATILQVTNFFVLNSRLIVALVGLYRTALSVGLLYGSVYSWVLSSVCILIPVACIRSFQWVLYLGKAMSVRDVDILEVFCIKPGDLRQRADKESTKNDEEIHVHKRSRLSFSDTFGAINLIKSSNDNNDDNNNQASEESAAYEEHETASNANVEQKRQDEEEANKRVAARPHKLSVTKYQSISGISNDEEDEHEDSRQFNITDFYSDDEEEDEEEVRRGTAISSDEEEEEEGVGPPFAANNVVNGDTLSLASFFNSALSVTTSVVTLGLVNLDEVKADEEVGANISFEK